MLTMEMLEDARMALTLTIAINLNSSVMSCIRFQRFRFRVSIMKTEVVVSLEPT